MGVMVDICRKMTNLSGRQIEELKQLSKSFSLVADLAHAHFTVYAKAKEKSKLVIIAQVAPNTCFSQYKPNILGTKVRINEEPIVWRTMETGQSIKGKREWTFGLMLDMYTFAILDEIGEIIASVCFEANTEELNITGYKYLLDTVQAILHHSVFPDDDDIFHPLSASDGIIITNKDGKIIFGNVAASSIYKVLGIGHLIGSYIFDRQFTMHITKETIHSQKPYQKEIEAGNLILVQRSIPLYRNSELYRTVIIVSDVTELRKKEKELLIKSAVIQEIHHRVKNNLQTIASLLRLQARRTDSEQVRAALKESVNRILSISVVHEFLSQQDADFIDVAVVAKNILNLVTQSMADPNFELETQFKGNSMILPSEHASSLALVVNEAVQNSIEHAFEGRESGCIGVEISQNKDKYIVDIYDNGNGIPPDFNPRKSKRLGMQIIRTMVEDDLDGELQFYNDKGTHIKMIIPQEQKGEAQI